MKQQSRKLIDPSDLPTRFSLISREDEFKEFTKLTALEIIEDRLLEHITFDNHIFQVYIKNITRRGSFGGINTPRTVTRQPGRARSGPPPN